MEQDEICSDLHRWGGFISFHLVLQYLISLMSPTRGSNCGLMSLRWWPKWMILLHPQIPVGRKVLELRFEGRKSIEPYFWGILLWVMNNLRCINVLDTQTEVKLFVNPSGRRGMSVIKALSAVILWGFSVENVNIFLHIMNKNTF